MEGGNQPGTEPSLSTVCRLTGPQPSAIAVFELHGPRAFEVAATHLWLRNQQPLSQQPMSKIAFGYWKHQASLLDPNEAIATEDVVFCRTGPASAELHTHGSAAIANSILSAFRSSGVVVVNPNERPSANSEARSLPLPMIMQFLEPEWWEPSVGRVTPERWERLCNRLAAAEFPTHDLCRLQSRAYERLACARGGEVGRLLWAQLRGAWLLRLESIAEKVDTRSEDALSDLDALLATWSWGQFLGRDVQVLVTGAPNVGKSSLINALLGYQRNVVSDRPGTTRDLVGQATAMSGWQVRLVDSAGLRPSEDDLEAQGIQLATAAAQQADVVVVVRSVDVPGSTSLLLPENVPVISVLNKIDLLDGPIANLAGQLELGDSHAVSTKTGQGLQELVQRIVSTAVPQATRSETSESSVRPAVVFAAELGQILRDWRARLSKDASEKTSAGADTDG